MRQIVLLAALLLAGLHPALAFGSTGASPAEHRIRLAAQLRDAEPDEPSHRVELAMAFASRARETHDPENYERAQSEIDQVLRLEPDNFAARRAGVWIQLGTHEFASAHAAASQLNQSSPHDSATLAMLFDAQMELGMYADAEQSVERLLELVPGSPVSLTRASYLLQLWGDIDGALDLLKAALDATPSGELEERAWLWTHIGQLERHRGDLDAASVAVKTALELFPSYHYALSELGEVQMERGDRAGAVASFRERYRQAPHPECLFDLAVALQAAGETVEAREAFAEFESAALAESPNWDNANPQLIRYYIDVAARPEAALEIAEREFSRRRDLFTVASRASALHAVGRITEAVAGIDSVLAMGIKDPSILRRAAQIRGEEDSTSRPQAGTGR